MILVVFNVIINVMKIYQDVNYFNIIVVELEIKDLIGYCICKCFFYDQK